MLALTDNDYSFTELVISLTEYDSRQEDGVLGHKLTEHNVGMITSVDVYIRYSATLDYMTL